MRHVNPRYTRMLDRLICSEANSLTAGILLNYKLLSKKSSIFRSLTGLEVSEFDSFYAKVDAKCGEHETKRLSRDKKCAFGAK